MKKVKIFMWWVMMCCRGCPSYLRSLDLKVYTKRVLCLMTSQGQFDGRNSTTGFSESSTSQAVITIKITWGAFVTYTYQGPTQDLLNKNICARAQLGTLKKLPKIVLLAAINQIVRPLIENLSSRKIGGQYSLFSRAQIIQTNCLWILFFNFFENWMKL